MKHIMSSCSNGTGGKTRGFSIVCMQTWYRGMYRYWLEVLTEAGGSHWGGQFGVSCFVRINRESDVVRVRV